VGLANRREIEAVDRKTDERSIRRQARDNRVTGSDKRRIATMRFAGHAWLLPTECVHCSTTRVLGCN
jgi:hypothetical protein